MTDIEDITKNKNYTSCFIGTRLEAMKALCLYTNVSSILTRKDSYVHKYCKANKIATIVIDKYKKGEIFSLLSQQSVDLVLSAGFPWILPDYALRSGPIYINSHPALLPAYKGYNAIREAFNNGEEYMGVTVHYMVEEVDSGALICQEKVWVKGVCLQDMYSVLFGIVEPIAIMKSLDLVLHNLQTVKIS